MQLKNSIVTVVIPTFNRKNQLSKAVESVIDQHVEGVIIHIFDNCSDDGTDELIAELESRHSNIQHTLRPENIGPLANYADAIASAKTPFYLPLADDDWLLPGSLRILLDEILADDRLGAVISQTIHMSEDGREGRVNPDETWDYRRYEPAELFPLWVKKGHFEWSSLMFRTSAVKEIGGLDTETRAPSDIDLQLQLFLRYPVKLIKHRSAVYLMHPKQYSVQYDPKTSLGIFHMIVKAKCFVFEKPCTSIKIKKSLNEFSRCWCARMAGQLAYHGNLSDIRHINKTLRKTLPYYMLRIWFRFCYVRYRLQYYLLKAYRD